MQNVGFLMTRLIFVLFGLLLYIHGKQVRSFKDGQLSLIIPNHTFLGQADLYIYCSYMHEEDFHWAQ